MEMGPPRSLSPGATLEPSLEPAPKAADNDSTATIVLRGKTRDDKWRRKLLHTALGAGAVLIALALWELLARTEILPASAFPAATDTLLRLGGLSPSETFWASVWETISIAALGLLIVIVIAIPAGIAIGRSPRFERSTLLVVEFLKPIPPVALLPLALLFWGPSAEMKLFLVCIGAVWPLLVQVAYGARGLDKTQMDVARSYRLSRYKTIRYIIFPSLTPYALTGIRVSATIAIIVAVVAELIGGAPGLGQQITLAQNSADLATMYAYIITTGLLGVAINGFFVLAGKPLLFWHPSERSAEG